MFSIDFGQNVSQIWIINFGITTVGDLIFKDVLVAAILVFFALYLSEIKEKCKKRN